jgi:hypothetical protein
MTVFAGARMYKYTNKVEHVRFFRVGWVTEMVDMVCADVNGWRELKMVVDLPTAKVGQIEFEALQMEDEVIGHLFETCPNFVSFVLCHVYLQLTA